MTLRHYLIILFIFQIVLQQSVLLGQAQRFLDLNKKEWDFIVAIDSFKKYDVTDTVKSQYYKNIAFNSLKSLPIEFTGVYDCELGFHEYVGGDFLTAKIYFKSCFDKCTASRLDYGLSLYYRYSSLIDLEEGRFFDYLTKSTKLRDYVAIEPDLEEDIINRLGKVYTFFKKYDQANLEFEKLVKIEQNKKKDWNGKGYFYMDYARLLGLQHRNQLAMHYYVKAIDYFSKKGNNVPIGVINNLLGDLNVSINTSQAINYYKKGVEMNAQNGVMLYLLESWVGLGNIYMSLNDKENVAKVYKHIVKDINPDLINLSLPAMQFLAGYSRSSENLKMAQMYNNSIAAYMAKNGESVRKKELNMLESFENLENASKLAQAANEKIAFRNKMFNITVGFVVGLICIILLLLYFGKKNEKMILTLQQIAKKKEEKLSAIENNFQHLSTLNASLQKEYNHMDNSLLRKEIQLKYEAEMIEKMAVDGKAKPNDQKLNNIILGDDFWNEIYGHQIIIHTKLEKHLKPHKLTDYELQLCQLLSENYALADIAKILQKSYNSIKVTKSRLKAKLIDDAEVDLKVFLQAIIKDKK